MDIPGLRNPGLTDYEKQQLYNNNVKQELRELHNHIVTSILSFCRRYDVDCDEVMMQIDNMEVSLQNYGNIGSIWNQLTKSILIFAKYNDYGELQTVMKSE